MAWIDAKSAVNPAALRGCMAFAPTAANFVAATLPRAPLHPRGSTWTSGTEASILDNAAELGLTGFGSALLMEYSYIKAERSPKTVTAAFSRKNSGRGKCYYHQYYEECPPCARS
ncbi:hypothetical protein B0A55_09874 [Friedmanniomyces simplex]|uniref:Uncharacterized protein n=1 Tax=Friedmanniomyces simplex TaxID=329884 RepID=A0A4V5NDJ1_9PEZI|nr:hypothetical protein B0A55_09874 [Friedmanniomyces simplex]